MTRSLWKGPSIDGYLIKKNGRRGPTPRAEAVVRSDKILKVQLPDGRVVTGRLTRRQVSVAAAGASLTDNLLDLAGGGTVVGKFVDASRDPATSVTLNWMRVGRSLKTAARKIAKDGPKPAVKVGAATSER